ncbi:MAG TPA: cobalamin biosynthesis protein CobQ [Ruminococcus sp.]|nr:cobalamin biosynthesis protein CobQ [Ruminococcus sp.]
MKKITVITGHYGSGKTNISVNLAVNLAEQGNKVCIVDLDIVNPYFRTADFEKLFSEKNIELVKPMYANTNLDIPAISFDLERIAAENGYLIIDVGGDDSGAVALGRYAEALEAYADDLDMLCVVNQYRYMTHSSDEALELLYEIEAASRMKHTGIINNSNLGMETTPENIADSVGFAEEISQKSGLPIAFTAFRNGISAPDIPGKLMRTEVYVKPVWEQ